MQIVISLLGGLGLFLYGMNLMGESLEKVAGSKMKKIIELLTKNIFMGVLLGAVVTAVIQSSSATTVMVVGFVNAGLMGLPQAVGVIMGANIGTTVTAQIVSFDLTGMAPLALGIGILLYLFAGNEKYKQVGEVFIGFGLLFTGIIYIRKISNTRSSSWIWDNSYNPKFISCYGDACSFSISRISSTFISITYIIWTKYRNLCNIINIKYWGK